LAASLGAVSVDHLDYIEPTAVEQLKQHGVIPVLLPGAVFFLGQTRYAPARYLIDSRLPVALATDFNPGSSMIQSMPLIFSLACIYMRMHPHECWIASTINAAQAICLSTQVGNFDDGKQADIIIWNMPNENYLPYHIGVNLVEMVIKKGRIMPL
jgi:imidazolonepropionase